MPPSSEVPEMLPLDIESIAKLTGQRGPHSITLHQTQHRVGLTQFWNILPNEKVLEIGCGQGDCTIVLASAVGDGGHVTAIDPAPLDYGSPATLGEAQAHVKSGPIGSRVTFIQADPRDYLRNLPSPPPRAYTFDTAVLSHSIWYFSSPSVLSETIVELAKHTRRICIAEYALTASKLSAIPHVLATLTEASLECRKENSKSNIRTILSPAEITKIVLESSSNGLKVVKERVETPKDLEDGFWEVGLVKSEKFNDEIEGLMVEEKEKAVVRALRDSTVNNLALLKSSGGKVTTMDVWAAVFTSEAT